MYKSGVKYHNPKLFCKNKKHFDIYIFEGYNYGDKNYSLSKQNLMR
jgi:hypothetical protein